MSKQSAPATIDAYIAAHPPKVRAVLEKIRGLVAATAPRATERISYGMPAFAQDGIIIFFAAFKQHIGIYPPVRGDAKLMQDLAPYSGEKGNLKFPLDEPMPYPLIKRVVKAQLAAHLERLAAKSAKKKAAKPAGKKSAKAAKKVAKRPPAKKAKSKRA
jgi:uncharacterized protein YdhG (YjbR/CyaY superfamily)